MLYRKIVKFVIYEFKIKTYKRERTLEKKMGYNKKTPSRLAELLYNCIIIIR